MCNGTYLLGDRILQCYCPNCDPLHDVRIMWYHGEAWHRDIPKRKPRRVGLIRAVWQHVHRCEDWVYPIHTLDHHQRMVRILAARNLAAYVATDTTQGRLTSIE